MVYSINGVTYATKPWFSFSTTQFTINSLSPSDAESYSLVVTLTYTDNMKFTKDFKFETIITITCKVLTASLNP